MLFWALSFLSNYCVMCKTQNVTCIFQNGLTNWTHYLVFVIRYSLCLICVNVIFTLVVLWRHLLNRVARMKMCYINLCLWKVLDIETRMGSICLKLLIIFAFCAAVDVQGGWTDIFNCEKSACSILTVYNCHVYLLLWRLI